MRNAENVFDFCIDTPSTEPTAYALQMNATCFSVIPSIISFSPICFPTAAVSFLVLAGFKIALALEAALVRLGINVNCAAA